MSKVSPDIGGSSRETDDVQLLDTLTCIQKLVALSGLSWDYHQFTSSKWRRVAVVASRIYSSLVFIFLILYFIQMIPYYSKAASFSKKGLSLTSIIAILSCITYWTLSINIHRKVRIFHERICETRFKFKSCVSAAKMNQIVKRTRVCLLVLAACYSGTSVLMINFVSDTSSAWYMYWPSLLLLSIIAGCTCLLNHSLLLLFLSISLLLTYEYDNCTLRLSRASEGSIKEEDIEDTRGYHASLTDLVEHVCSLMSRHVAVGYVSSLITVCFCLYSIINDGKSISNIGGAAAALYISTLYLITLTYIGVRLHVAAHRPLKILLDMSGKYLPDRVIGLVTLFAIKLSQRQIGISALGLMTITKDTILTIIGTLLTYVFIVIQFKPNSTGGIQHSGNATAA